MKRIESACVCQTIRFAFKDDTVNEFAKKQIATEVANYKETLDRNRTKYKILEETTGEDGSVVIKIIKQYNSSPIGDYFN